MQAHGQIVLLAIVAAILKNKESLPLLVGDASISAANKEVEKADAQHHKERIYTITMMMKFELKLPSTVRDYSRVEFSLVRLINS